MDLLVPYSNSDNTLFAKSQNQSQNHAAQGPTPGGVARPWLMGSRGSSKSPGEFSPEGGRFSALTVTLNGKERIKNQIVMENTHWRLPRSSSQRCGLGRRAQWGYMVRQKLVLTEQVKFDIRLQPYEIP